MRLILAALLLVGGRARAQEPAFDALAELFARETPAGAIPERGERLAKLSADLTLAAQGLEAFRSPEDAERALKLALERVPPELKSRLSSRRQALDALYRTLAVTDYTWAARFPGENCSALERRARLLASPDALFKDPKTGEASPWVVHLLGPDASKGVEKTLDQASSGEAAKGRAYELLRAKTAKAAAALEAAPEDRRAWLHCLRGEAYESLARANQASEGPIAASRGTIPSRGVALIGKTKDGAFEAHGAGVLITTKAGARILTDAKVVGDGDGYQAAFPDKGAPIPVTIERKGETLAVLSSPQDLGEGRELANADPAKDDLVTVVSHSEQLGAWAWTQGLVSAAQDGAFQTDAVVDAAQAGGAVLDESGRVAGLLTLRNAEAEDGEGEWPVGVPASSIKSWLEGGKLQPASRPVALRDAGTSAIISASYIYAQTPWGTVRARCLANCGDGGGATGGTPGNGGFIGEDIGRALGEAAVVGLRAMFRGLGAMFRSKGNGFKPRSSPTRVVKAEKPKPIEPPKPPPPPEPRLFLNISAAQERIGAGQTGEFIVRVTANRLDVKLSGIKIAFKAVDGAGGVQEDEAWTDASGVAKFRAYLPPSVAAHEDLDDESAKHPRLTNASSPGKKTVCQITVTALGALAVTASLAPVATVALAGGGTAALAAGATPLPVTACAAVGAGLAALSHGTCNLVLSDEPGRAVEPKPSRETPEALPPQRSADRRPGQATKESVVADARGAHDELSRMAKEMAAQEGGTDAGVTGQPADPGEEPSNEADEGSAKCSIDKPDSFRGASLEEVERSIPRNWTKTQTRYGDGIRYTDPNTRGADQIRVMPGNLRDPNLVKRGPYLRYTRNGKSHDEPIPLRGNPTLP